MVIYNKLFLKQKYLQNFLINKYFMRQFMKSKFRLSSLKRHAYQNNQNLILRIFIQQNTFLNRRMRLSQSNKYNFVLKQNSIMSSQNSSDHPDQTHLNLTSEVSIDKVERSQTTINQSMIGFPALINQQIKRVLHNHNLYIKKQNKKQDHLQNLQRKQQFHKKIEQDDNFSFLKKVKNQLAQKRLNKIKNKIQLNEVQEISRKKWISPQIEQKENKIYYVNETITKPKSPEKLSSISHIFLNQKFKYFGDYLRSEFDHMRSHQKIQNRIPSNKTNEKYKAWYAQFSKIIFQKPSQHPKMAILAPNLDFRQDQFKNPLEYNDFYSKYIRHNSNKFTQRFLAALIADEQEFTFNTYLKFYKIFISQQATDLEKVDFIYKFFTYECSQKITIEKIKETISLLCENLKNIEEVSELRNKNIKEKLIRVIIGNANNQDQGLEFQDFKSVLLLNQDSVYIFFILMYQNNPEALIL